MIHIEDGSFRDDGGRTLMLRGVNVAGSSKVPSSPNGATHLREGFLDHRRVSFVGRPFPLEDAEEHFARLSGWGFTVLRLVVTWEAIEHAGPGIYDEEYLEYILQLVTLAGQRDLAVLVDPHQDMWSRFSGGDGAARLDPGSGWVRPGGAGRSRGGVHPSGSRGSAPGDDLGVEQRQAGGVYDVHPVSGGNRFCPQDPRERRAGAGVPAAPLRAGHDESRAATEGRERPHRIRGDERTDAGLHRLEGSEPARRVRHHRRLPFSVPGHGPGSRHPPERRRSGAWAA